MSNKDFPGDLKPLNELKSNQKEFLIEHYKRCEGFLRHWTPMLWSIPSVAAAINVGAYSLIFDSNKNIQTPIKFISLSVLIFLNFTLFVGVWKHRYLQQIFRRRVLDLEKYASIPTFKHDYLHEHISASLCYVILMLILLIMSITIFIYEVACLK